MSRLGLAIAVKGGWDAQQLLQDLRDAGADPSTEIHVACEPEHIPPNSPRSLVILPQSKASLFDLWGTAIAATDAAWVAILHANALPAPGWFSAMTEAIEQESWGDGYWGPVEPDFGPSDSRMIGYLTEYVQFHRPIGADMNEIPGSNLVLPRERLGHFRDDFSKTRLLGEGLAPRLVEGAKVRYARPLRFGAYCARRYRHGRAYAAKRTPTLSVLKAIPLALALPFVRTARIQGSAWQHPQLRGALLRWLLPILLAESCWSLGELIGYLTRNPGDQVALD